VRERLTRRGLDDACRDAKADLPPAEHCRQPAGRARALPATLRRRRAR
jgi:hypothetical protein